MAEREKIIEAARAMCRNADLTLEVDDDAQTSTDEKNTTGRFVSVWLWVSNEDLEALK